MSRQSAPAGTVQFCDNVPSALPADDYTLTVTQTATGNQIDSTFEHQQRMLVTGPHFGLDAGDVRGVYPPAAGAADYREYLAAVVLNRRDLPWAVKITDAGQDGGPESPWLAVLLLTPEEIVTKYATAPRPPPTPTGAHVVPLSEYLNPPDGMPAPAFTQPQLSEFAQLYPEDFTLSVIDIDPAAFSETAPARHELGYLAHARNVDTDHQETPLGLLGATRPAGPAGGSSGSAAAGRDEDDGWVSVVVGNRLAVGRPTGAYCAHLVSVEGFTRYLPPAALPSGSPAVRMASLASWTFNSIPVQGDFAGLMRNLSVDLLRLPQPSAVPPLPFQPGEPPDPRQLVASALASGYTPHSYQTRLGETTAGWYRGPCLPVPMKRNEQEPYRAAEAALSYDDRTGMFDVSYAVAWQLGRLLLLANRQLVSSLLSWLRANHTVSQLLLERLHLARSHSLLGFPSGSADLLDRHLPRTLARAQITSGLAARLTPAAGSGGTLGPACDPTGLLRHLHRLPGMLNPAHLGSLAAGGGDPTLALLAQLRSPGTLSAAPLDMDAEGA